MSRPNFTPEPVRPPPSGDIQRIAAGLLIAGLLIAALRLGQEVLLPLAVSILISFALAPLVSWLVRIGVSRLISVLLVMMTVFALIGGLGMLVATQVRGLSGELPRFQTTIKGKISDLGEQMRGPGFMDRAFEMVGSVQKEVEAAVGSNEPAAVAQERPPRVEVVPAPMSPIDTAVAWLVPALEPLATTGIVLVFVFIILLDRSDLRDRLLRLLGGNLHRSTDAMAEAGSRISRYLLMQLVVNVTYAIPMTLGLWLIGVPGWLLWGTMAAVMRFIPYLGPILSAIFPIALAFAVDPGWEMVMWTIALIVVLELVSNNIVEPLLYGSSTGLSAISIIAAAMFWAALWGPVGLVLSTPLTVCLLVLGRNLPQLSFLETLLGSQPALDTPTRIYQRLLADDSDEAIAIAFEEIEDTSVLGFYDDVGLEVLRQASADFHVHARAEHRLRIANGMDLLLEDLVAEYPVAPAGPATVVCFGGKWDVDSFAAEMLVHSLGLSGVPAEHRQIIGVNNRTIEGLELDAAELVCVGYFTPEPDAATRAFLRRLRRHWPELKIVLAYWNAPANVVEQASNTLEADGVVTSINEAVLRIRRILDPDVRLEIQQAAVPENDQARVEALETSGILDGHAREDFDALAKRAADVFNVEFAVISAIDAKTEYIIGQSMELEGERTTDGTDTIIMPRNEAICDHVVSSGEALVVEDTARDPRFSDHPAITLWETRFYAGAPLKTRDGLVLGAFCLLDREPRELGEEELALLAELAADAVELITGEDASKAIKDAPKPPSSSTVGQLVPD